MKSTIHPDFSSLTPFVLSLPERFDANGTTLYKVRNTIKVFEDQGFQIAVKRFRVPPAFNRFMYTYLRKSKAQRAYENASRLLELGFDTPKPIGYLECYKGGLLHHSFYVSMLCPYTRLFKEFADGSEIGNRTDIVQALGVYIGRMHQSGILHKDLSIGNILFEVGNEGVQFSLVDVNRMRFCTINFNEGCKNFERLRGNNEFFALLAETYAATRNYSTEACLGIMLAGQQKSIRYFQRKSAWKQFRKRFHLVQ